MKPQKEIMAVVNTFARQLNSALGDKLNAVILYGSYARGDYEDGSDVDVMVILNAPNEKTVSFREQIRDIAHHLEDKNEVILSIVIESAENFYKFKDASGFFKNVLNEGIRINIDSETVCFFCKGKLETGITTHVVSLGKSTIVVKSVPCLECTECGRSSYDDETAARLEQIVGSVRTIPGLETAIINFKRPNLDD
jgi:YgiT-type zinc finger domain-containing protein